MAAEWYYASGGQQLGPVNTEELRAALRDGNVKPSDLVWKEGMPDWAPAATVSVLKSAQAPAPQPKPRPQATTSAPQRIGSDPQPAPQPQVQITEPDAGSTSPPKQKKKRSGFVGKNIAKVKALNERLSGKQKIAVGGGFLVFLALAIVMAMMFTGEESSFDHHARYAPDGAVVGGFVDVAKIYQTEFFQQLERKVDELEDISDEMDTKLRLTPADIDSFSFWVDADDDVERYLMIVRTKVSIPDDAALTLEEMSENGEEDVAGVPAYTVNGRLIAIPIDGRMIAIPTNKTFVIGPKELLEEVFERGDNPANFSSTMKQAIDSVKFDKAVTVVGNLDRADAIYDQIPGGSAIDDAVGPIVLTADVTNQASVSFSVLNKGSEGALFSVTVSADAVKLVELVKEVQDEVAEAEEQTQMPAE